MSDWQEVKLGSLGKVITGKTPSKDNPEDWGHAALFVTPSDYKNYRKKAYSSIRMLSEVGVDRQKQRLLPAKSVLVTCIGSDMGKTVVNALPCVTNQQINAIIPNKAVIDPDYLYYITKDLYSLLSNLGGDGTAVPILNKTDFENIDVVIPALEEQKSIASVLSSLDDKIDLLHRQNKTLEAMAETLFRQWFVEGAGDWSYVELGSVIETTSGGTPSRSKMEYYEDGAINWVKSKELSGSFILDTEEKITETALRDSSAKLLPKNSILIAMYGATVGEYAIISKEMTCNQAVCALKPNENYPFTFLFMYVKANKEELINMAVGSAQQNISQLLIKQLLVPDCHKEISSFHDVTIGIFDRIQLNIRQIGALGKLRDNLLPKLMSGEVRVI
jgi:type I restriction enzyme S subunit